MKKYAVFGFCLLIVLFLSFYKLTESPPTWMDEGVITQVARNMALNGKHAVQTAPEQFAMGSFISTAYPATFPVSLSFRIFGTGILQSRVVMALFITCLFSAVFLFLKRDDSVYSGAFLGAALLLVATFAPLYGHGKNLLGEIPGLCYFFLSLIFLRQIGEGTHKNLNYILCGFFLGLAIVTKPIFLLFGPAALITWFLYRKKELGSVHHKTVLVACAALPFIVWLFIQFQGDSWASVMSLYGNPNAVNNPLWTNIKRFFTEAQPVYTLVLFLSWTVSGILRYRKGKPIGPAETLSWSFSLLIFMSYIRTAGFYRYFFPAEFISLVFLAGSLKEAVAQKYHATILFGLGLLICLQSYQTFFNSWVSTHNEGRRSAELAGHIGKLDPKESVLFYQAPEAVNFLNSNHRNYFQFIRITPVLAIGDGALAAFEKKNTDLVVTSSEFASSTLFAGYKVKESFNSYVILGK